MAEWSIALPWKGSNWATGSGVRIPVSPPFVALLSQSLIKCNIYTCQIITSNKYLILFKC